MGMCYSFTRISDDKFQNLKDDPFIIFLYHPQDISDDDCSAEMYRELVQKSLKPKLSFWQRLFPKKNVEKVKINVEIPEIQWQENEHKHGDIEKSWNLIHAGLTGKSEGGEWPFSFLMDEDNADYSDNEMDSVFGYKSSKVKEIADLLQNITGQDLINQLNLMDKKEMEKVYLSEIWFQDNENSFEYITENFEYLKRFILKTAELGFGIIFQVN